MYKSFDPETLDALRRVLDEASGCLPNDGFAQGRKAILAARLLALASDGETDPVRLRTGALADRFPY